MSIFSLLLSLRSTKNNHNHYFAVVRRTGESGEWDQHPQIHTNNSITSYQMTGLLPFTIYSFRVLAVNSLGISLPSKESYYIVTLREGLYSSFLRFNMIYAYDSLSQNYTINPSKFFKVNFIFITLCFLAPLIALHFFYILIDIKRENEFSSPPTKESKSLS